MKTASSLLLALAFTLHGLLANDIRNGDFIDGLKSWVIQREGYETILSKEANTYCRFEDGAVILETSSIENKKEKPASLILMQYLKDIKEGAHYQLSFEMKVPSGETMTYGLGIPVQSGTNKGNLAGGLRLVEHQGTGDWETVTHEFFWNPADAHGRGLRGAYASIPRGPAQRIWHSQRETRALPVSHFPDHPVLPAARVPAA